MAQKAIDALDELPDDKQTYNYQPELTKKLDELEGIAFKQELVNEIALWKLDRHFNIPTDILKAINSLATLAPGEHRKAGCVLLCLLNIIGVDIAMASTIFRFRNPRVFQIIDRHAYRAVYGEKLRLYTATPSPRKIELYFTYLDDLRELAGRANVDFEDLDRILYQFDKRVNGVLD
jgi:hypothetical protein